jgi:hypothetical protein
MPVPAVTAKGRTWLGAGVVALVLGAGATPAAALTHIGATKPSGATFQVHMTVNGAVRGSLVFKVIELDTPCTGGTGPGSAGEDGVPSPDGGNVKFDGVLLEYAINNPSYKGPGKYGTADFANGSAAISVDKASEADPFAASSHNATETLLWKSSRSGTFVFKDWQNGAANRSLNGNFSWTCKN